MRPTRRSRPRPAAAGCTASRSRSRTRPMRPAFPRPLAANCSLAIARRAPLSLQSAIDWKPGADPKMLKGLRIGWLGDLGGYLATEPGVIASCRDALRHLESAGAAIEELPLGFDTGRLWDAWLTWRRAI